MRINIKRIIMYLFIISVISFEIQASETPYIFGATASEIYQLNYNDPVDLNTDPYGDLEPIENAEYILNKALEYLYSDEVEEAVKKSRVIEIIRERLKTGLFHLNLEPEFDHEHQPIYKVIDNRYPYDSVFEKRFPKRPTLEFLEQVITFTQRVKKIRKGKAPKSKAFVESVENYVPFLEFQFELEKRMTKKSKAYQNSDKISKAELLEAPVDTYVILRERLKNFGEVASFPEFRSAVEETLKALMSDADLMKLSSQDEVLQEEVDAAISALKEVMQAQGRSSTTQAEFNAPFPYRRTYLALEKAVEVFDIVERLKYKESHDWFEVEDSWYPKESGFSGKPKLLPLYHFNRYKYQQFGLLSNPNIVLLPWSGDATEEDLLKLRPTPIGLIGLSKKTLRADRHHNSPLDFWYHDVNHVRRMWGYDKRLALIKSLNTWGALIDDMKTRENFMDSLISDVRKSFNLDTPQQTPADEVLFDMMLQTVFETFHETALAATREALLNDLLRFDPVRQPFERQIQTERGIEFIRTFDGNVDSGADKLPLDLSKPTLVRYYWDRAPSFIANVYNKIAWGFHNSPYLERQFPEILKHRTPENMAQTVSQLLDILKFKEGEYGARRPDLKALAAAAANQDGQPELYNYYSLHPENDDSERGKALIGQKPADSLIDDEIRKAKAIKQRDSRLSPIEVAQQVQVGEKYIEMVKWMQKDLEHYLENFDELFENKLKRIVEHEKIRRADLATLLEPVEQALREDPENQELLEEKERIEKEHRPHAFVAEFKGGVDFVRKFVGKRKLLMKRPTPQELRKMNEVSQAKLYVDTWAVPFFNTATQSKMKAKKGLEESIAQFKKADLKSMNLYEFMNLVALFARPEFNDVRRYKLKVFPTAREMEKFRGERSDAYAIGERFPDEVFTVTNQELSKDQLSYSFGRKVHYMGLVSHADGGIYADGRNFTGPADFLEHDQSHAYFNLHPSVPGTPEDWEQIHEEFFFQQAQLADSYKRDMRSLVYFHFTHESGYKSLVEDEKGNAPAPDEYLEEINFLKEQINTRNYYDWVKDPNNFPNGYIELLEEAFAEVSEFFKDHVDRIVARDKMMVPAKRHKSVYTYQCSVLLSLM